ncbi:hypothetical protein [Prosthecobacter sp.]|uniref:hypothetical protein n=1 Tax=Prosthecobacter sp. TaxID=1965333 RepID=UPI00248A8DB3|nr:hypothetical protein [Prosthecobacter sp.]MDI1312540.1 hypothetical protein [Prosthecobacter sp.]
MKTVPFSRLVGITVSVLLLTLSGVSAQMTTNCTEISNDVRIAVEKDPSKVLMVVEDALVINEGCAGDIVRTAIIASKADATLASQIVQTGASVAPKMAAVINDAALSVVPSLATVAPVSEIERPIMVSAKNPKNPIYVDKNPIIPTSEPDFYIPSNIRGVFLIMPPISGPLPPRIITIPVSPSTALP